LNYIFANIDIDQDGTWNSFGCGTTSMQVEITEYGSFGNYISGTLSGTSGSCDTNNNIPVSGSFRVKND